MSTSSDYKNTEFYARLLKEGRRLFAPVGGRTPYQDGKIFDKYNCCSMESINMLYQIEEYGYDLVSATVPMKLLTNSLFSKNTSIRQKLKMLEPYIQCVGETKWFSDKMVGGATFGPLTIAAEHYGAKEILVMSYRDPAKLHDILRYITGFFLEFFDACERESPDFCWIAEPMGAILSPDQFEEFTQSYMAEIFSNVKRPGILHIPGSTHHIVDYLVDTKAQCLSLDSKDNICDLLSKFPPYICIRGIINTYDLLYGSCELIRRKTIQFNQDIEGYRNVIVGSGGGIIDGTSRENILEMRRVTVTYPKY